MPRRRSRRRRKRTRIKKGGDDDCVFAGYCKGDEVTANVNFITNDGTHEFDRKKTYKIAKNINRSKDRGQGGNHFFWLTLDRNGKEVQAPHTYFCTKDKKVVGEHCQIDCSKHNKDEKDENGKVIEYKTDGFGGCTRKGTLSSLGGKWDSKINGWKITHPNKYKNFMFQGLKDRNDKCKKRLMASECKFGMSCRDGICQEPQSQYDKDEECKKVAQLSDDIEHYPTSTINGMEEWEKRQYLRRSDCHYKFKRRGRNIVKTTKPWKLKLIEAKSAAQKEKEYQASEVLRKKNALRHGIAARAADGTFATGGKTRRRNRRRKRTKKKRRRKSTKKKKRRRRRKRTRRRK